MQGKELYESYYDGLSPEFKHNQERMTEQEREDSLLEEQKRCNEMKEW